MTVLQFTHLTDRLDYLSAHMNNWGWALAVEQALRPRGPGARRVHPRDHVRAHAHLLAPALVGRASAWTSGAFTPFLYGFRDREKVNDIFEKTCGARLTMNYIRARRRDRRTSRRISRRTCARSVDYFKPVIDEYETLLSRQHHHPGAHQGRRRAQRRAGPLARLHRPDAAGQRRELRRAQEPPVRDLPERFDFQVAGGDRGRQLGALQGAHRGNAPEPARSSGRPSTRCRRGRCGPRSRSSSRCRRAATSSRVEAARGEIAFFLVGDGTDKP